MTQIQAYESMSKEALIEHHKHTLQQHADDMDMLSKELASRVFMVPDGYKLVPIEPINEMLDRAVAFALNVQLSGDYGWTQYMRDLWATMLVAYQTGDVKESLTPRDASAEWVVSLDGRSLQSSDFKHDVRLTISGDFESDGQRRAYSRQLAKRLSTQIIQVYKINDISGSVDSDLSQPCTCPSGDGSLRWPCPVHPPETFDLMKWSNQQASSTDKKHGFTECVFIGDPPSGYESWVQWAATPIKKGVQIIALTKCDHPYPDNAHGSVKEVQP